MKYLISFDEYKKYITREDYQTRSFARFFHLLSSKYYPILNNKKIVDFGCGNGEFFSLISSNNNYNIGVDIQESLLYLASNKNIYGKLTTSLSNSINEVDVIFSNSVLEHVLNLTEVLTQLHAILKNNGHFFLTVPIKGWENNTYGELIKIPNYGIDLNNRFNHINLHTLDEWQKIFMKIGFKVKNYNLFASPISYTIADLLLRNENLEKLLIKDLFYLYQKDNELDNGKTVFFELIKN